MAVWWYVAVLAAVVLVRTAAGLPSPQHLTHRVVMDQAGKYVMFWTPLEDRIVIEVQVETRGYVSLGFSPSGGMKGADIVLGWMDDASGRLFLHDRYSRGYAVPGVDESQDVELLDGDQNDTHTVLRFSRPWVTCDDENDVRLTSDTVRVIWAYGDEDPKDEMTMRQQRDPGTKSLYLKEPQLVLPRRSEDVQTWDLLSPNVSLPDDLTTLYWCRLYKFPPITRKVHITGYVPVIKEENLPHIRHIQLYECHLPDSERHYEKWLDVHGLQCYGPNMPISWLKCFSPIILWTIGSEGEMYPDHTGFPLGEEHGGATYFMMETHYDNPNLRPGIVDASGLRVFYTDNLRPNDAGLLIVGHSASSNLIVPPRQTSWLHNGHCHGSCTQRGLPRGGIHVFQGLLHSHLLGSTISLRHIRDGQELPGWLEDMNYDFNYHHARMLRQEVTILPGDHLITECGYDSSSRRVTTFGGIGTEEEMCLTYLAYYPLVNFSACTSTLSTRNIFAGLGIEDIYKEKQIDKALSNRTEIDEEAETMLADALRSGNVTSRVKPMKLSQRFRTMVVKAPKKYYNTSVYDILHDEATWLQDDLLTGVQQEVVAGTYAVHCLTKGRLRVQEVPRTAPYPDFKALEPVLEQCGADLTGLTNGSSAAGLTNGNSAASLTNGNSAAGLTNGKSVADISRAKPLP